MPSAVTLSKEERRAVRRELGADDETVVILQTSRMQALKGQKRLLRAMAQLPAAPRTLCVEVGGPQRPEEQRYFDELHAFAAELGLGERVRFLGQRSDVPRLLAASDVYCQPNTLPDSFGIVLIEALAAGVPVVTADIGGPREIVTPEVGFLVGDDRSLTSTLELLAKSPALRRKLGAHGPARAHELCAPSLRLPEMERVLAGAVRGGPPPGRAA
jgi:glycosyltransferase involved in cell wall biosynthesis